MEIKRSDSNLIAEKPCANRTQRGASTTGNIITKGDK